MNTVATTLASSLTVVPSRKATRDCLKSGDRDEAP
jgi:hypothetical protein